MNQQRITERAQDTIQGCLVVGGVLLLAGLALTRVSPLGGILLAAAGQAVLLVGLIGLGVRLGTEAALRPSEDSVEVE